MKEYTMRRQIIAYPRKWLAYALVFASVALFCHSLMATEVVSLEFETQSLDLDTGNVADEFLSFDPENPASGDIKLTYNADRYPHAVVLPVGDGVAMAFVSDYGFDGVTVESLPELAFSSEGVDVPFTVGDCVVIRTAQGALYKLGNAVESGTSVTLNYALLQ